MRLRRAKGRGEFSTDQSVDKLLVEILEPMNRRAYDGCCGSGGMVVQAERALKSTAASAELLPTSGSSPQTCPSISAFYAAGLVHSRKTGTTVTHTLSHPLVVDLLTVARSRLHEVINDRMESLTELQTDFADQ